MKIERKNKELIIRVPEKEFGINEIQDLLDYLKAKTILSKSKGKEADVITLASEVKTSWWSTNKSRFL